MNQIRTIFFILIVILLLIVIAMVVYTTWFGNIENLPEITPQITIQATPTEILVSSATPSGPITFEFFTLDMDQILIGECITLAWEVKNSDNITLLRNDSPVLQAANAEDSFRDCLDQADTYIYHLEANNEAGYSEWMEAHVVAIKPTKTPVPTESPTLAPTLYPVIQSTPAYGQITIMFFSLEPTQINLGKCVELKWEVLNADTLRVLRNGEILLPFAHAKSSFQDCPSKTGIYRYRLETENSSGHSNYLELELMVN